MSKLLEIALSQYGVKEVAGTGHNNTIVNFAKEAGFTWVNDDETPWCSIFMNWIAQKAGCVRSGKANARSWLNTGQPAIEPKTGDVVVLKRGNNPLSGHVGIFISYTQDKRLIYVLGGNQGDEVKISQFTTGDILGFRTI